MLLRRIKKHVQAENWFAVLVDFVIVVVGVYVGIEVSNWNDKLQERDRAVKYLERINLDLEADLVAIKDRMSFWSQVIDYGESAITHAETGVRHEGSVGKTILAYYQASQVAPYASIDTTYQELKNSGDLRLIKNDQLIGLLADYYVTGSSLQADHLGQFIPEYREHIRGMTPWKLQKHIWANCYSVDKDAQHLIDCDLPLSDAAGIAILDQFTNDPEVVRGLRFWITNLSVARDAFEATEQRAEHIFEQIAAILSEDY